MKPAKTQPTQAERVCLRCGGTNVTVHYDLGSGVVWFTLALLSDRGTVCNEDLIACRDCRYTTDGRNFGATLAKRRKAASVTGHGDPCEDKLSPESQAVIDAARRVQAAEPVIDNPQGMEEFIPESAPDPDPKADVIARSIAYEKAEGHDPPAFSAWVPPKTTPLAKLAEELGVSEEQASVARHAWQYDIAAPKVPTFSHGKRAGHKCRKKAQKLARRRSR